MRVVRDETEVSVGIHLVNECNQTVVQITLCGCCMQEAKSTQYFYDAQVIERGSTLPDRGKRKSHAGGPPAKKPR